MILYFSGTGNSRYAAKRISGFIHEDTVSINEYLKQEKVYSAQKNERFVFVTPTYAWRIPRVVENFICNIQRNGSHEAYFVMTCGGETGNAEKYLKELCGKLNIKYFGLCSVVMPENYIAMFDVPDKETAAKEVAKAEPVIDKAAKVIADGGQFEKVTPTLLDKIYSGFINQIFYPAMVHAKKFRVKDTCISCGACEKLCPLNNISLKDGKPVWADKCTHCMACISHCPVSAIEYGKKSVNQPRYTCPK